MDYTKLPNTLVQDRNISDRVTEQIYALPQKDLLGELMDGPLKGKQVFLWGGVVRDAIRGIHQTPDDYDIVVDNYDKNILTKDELNEQIEDYFSNVKGVEFRRTRFNTMKLQVQGMLFDITTLINGNLYQQQKLPLENRFIGEMIYGCDLTTSAAAYDLRENLLYSAGAIEAIATKEIDILFEEADNVPILCARLFLHAEKLGFSVCEKGRDFVLKSAMIARESKELEAFRANMGRYLFGYKNYGETGERAIARFEEMIK